MWWVTPGQAAVAQEIGNVDLFHCAPTLTTWRSTVPTGPGFCTKIAWASDNPGYPIDATPAPPLKHVLGQVGEGC